jgi:hypothetical protein
MARLTGIGGPGARQAVVWVGGDAISGLLYPSPR